MPIRLKPFDPIDVQRDYFNYRGRFCTVPAGRRGGKTELACRRVFQRGLQNRGDRKRYFLGGPTVTHARKLYWDRLKMLCRDTGVGWIDKSEGGLNLLLPTNAEIWVLGFAEPDRFDGIIWHGGVLDEFADQSWEVWSEHIRPGLTDTLGWCDFIGVPAGRNHFFKMVQEYSLNPELDYWENFHWTTEQVLPRYLGIEAATEEIRQAKQDLDPRTFEQEYRASFVTFAGRAYYQYDPDEHATYRQKYDPELDLVLCLDFNVSPGVASIIQEQKGATRCIDEVYIHQDSNTLIVCDKFIEKYGNHRGHLYVYGDASGSAGGSAQVAGSDWVLVKQKLEPVFRERLHFKIPRQNGAVVARINAVNSRLKSVSGEIRMYIDPVNAPMTARDFEGVRSDDSGGILKQKGKDDFLTHMSDGIGYYLVKEFPVTGKIVIRNQAF